MASEPVSTYTERLSTFADYWKEHRTTAEQLAAIGHVYDRPPLETLEDGSRCVSCSSFVKRELSVKALGDGDNSSRSYEDDFKSFSFHEPSCTRLQVRIPLDPQAFLPGLHGGRIDDLRNRFERRSNPNRTGTTGTQKLSQSSSLFSLPTEIRLAIYAEILPSLDSITQIVQLNRDSPRLITSVGYEKTGRRDTTKPNILRTCRTVNEEAMDLLYSHTTFQFGSSKVMYLFLRSIGKSGRRLVKSVDVHCGGREDAISFALLASCEKLRSMCIRLPRPMLLFPRPPIWCFDGMSCLLALSGLEEVTFGKCASSFNYMSDEKPDAALIRRELTRRKGSVGDLRIVKKYLDT